jgi:hypothetical protein
MDQQPDHDGPPPLGSWRRTYALCCALAALTIFLLWLLTATFNLGPGR